VKPTGTSGPGEDPARRAAGGGRRAVPSAAAAWRAGALAVCVLPALVYLLLVPRAGHLQWHDYYIVLAGMVDGDRLTGDVGRWLTIKSNEHTVTVPALVYGANLLLFRGDNRPLAALAVLTQLAVVLLLRRRAPPELRRGPAALAAAALLAGLAFTPAASHQFFLGFSGVMWVVADLLAVFALLALVRSDESPRPALWACLCVAAGAAGAVTFSTTLAVWPALLLGALLLASGRRMWPGLALGALLVVHLAVVLYRRPAHHPGLAMDDIGAIVSFTAVFVGWILSPVRAVAAGLGWAGIGAAGAAWLAAATLRDGAVRRELAPWLMLQAYALGNGAMAAVARSGFGPAAPVQPRYGLLAALFWIGTFGALAVLALRRLPRRAGVPAGWAVAALAVLAAGATWRRGTGVAEGILADAAWHPVAAIAIRHGIADDWACRHVFNAGAREWFGGVGGGLRRFMIATRHVPFDRVTSPALGDVLAPAERAGAAPADLAGAVVRVSELPAGVHRVEAWVDPGAGELAEAIVVAADGSVRGELAALPHVAAAGAVGRRRAVAIAGYARPRPPTEPLRVVVRRAGERVFYPLDAPWSR